MGAVKGTWPSTCRVACLPSLCFTVSPTGGPSGIEKFIADWRDTGGSELPNTQSFINGLCHLLGVDAPAGNRTEDAHNDHPRRSRRGNLRRRRVVRAAGHRPATRSASRSALRFGSDWLTNGFEQRAEKWFWSACHGAEVLTRLGTSDRLLPTTLRSVSSDRQRLPGCSICRLKR